MKKALFILVAFGYSVVVIAQSKEIVPIILDGKPAYLNTTTGKVVSKKEALSKKYKKIKLKGFTSAIDENLVKEEIHTVRSGETLYAISRKYGLSVSKLKTLNNLISNTIAIDQKLLVK